MSLKSLAITQVIVQLFVYLNEKSLSWAISGQQPQSQTINEKQLYSSSGAQLDANASIAVRYLIGISVTLVASAVCSIGVNIQAAALKSQNMVLYDDDSTLIEKFWYKYRWYIGSVVSLGFMPPVVLATLGSVGLIFNVFSSYWLLGVKIKKNDWLGTFCIMMGCALVSVIGSYVPDENKDLPSLIKLFKRPIFIINFATQLILVIGMTVYALWETHQLSKLEKPLCEESEPFLETDQQRHHTISIQQEQLRRRQNHRSPLLSPEEKELQSIQRSSSGQCLVNSSATTTASPNTSANSSSTTSHSFFNQSNSMNLEHSRSLSNSSATSFLNTHHSYGDSDIAHDYFETSTTASEDENVHLIHKMASNRHDRVGIIYISIGAILSSQTLLLAKSGVGLLIISIIDSKNQFYGAFAFFLLFMLITLCLWQLFTFNRALYHAMPTLIIPISHTIFTCLSLFNSLIYLNQLTGVYTLNQFIVLIFGLILLIVGGWLLRHRH